MLQAFAYDHIHGARLSFGPFTIDVAHRVLFKDDTPLRLTLRCVELLTALVRHSGQTLTKEQLIESAWHDPSASDATLAQHIFLLRRALGDAATWIETVPQVGYRFNGIVEFGHMADKQIRSISI